jgi:hypothetical protein
MYNFTLQIIILVSLTVVVLVSARALPRLTEEEKRAESRRANFFDRAIVSKLPLDKFDRQAHTFLEKFLRRLKVLVMKTDNFVDDRINRVKKTKNEKTNGSVLGESTEKIGEEKENSQVIEATSQEEEKSL